MIALKDRRKPQSRRDDPSREIQWISIDETAQRIGITSQTLRNWRSQQKHDQPKFYPVPGARHVRYKLSEVDAWIESGGKEFNWR